MPEPDGLRRFGPMNSIGWTVGHLAWHEQPCWLSRAQSRLLFPELNELNAYGAPAGTSSLAAMLDRRRQATLAADPLSTV